jgi:hypothetical protein
MVALIILDSLLKQNGLEHHESMCMILDHQKINLGVILGDKNRLKLRTLESLGAEF